MSEYKPLQAVAYELLRDMIQDGKFAFDTIYSETKLASQFSISRTPVRDALIRLKNEHYIDILPNRGFCLHLPTREDILSGYHVRTAIECHCAALLAREKDMSRAAETLCRMQAALDAQRTIYASEDMDLRAFWKWDVEFHALLISYPEVQEFQRQYDAYMHFFMAHYVKNYRSDGRDKTTLDEHGRLMEALLAGDEAAALSAVRRHMDETLAITLHNMEAQTQDTPTCKRP